MTVLIILVLVSLLGVGGAQIAMMSERGARNDRDMQLAWQSGEAALLDAESDIHDSTSTRISVFDGKLRHFFRWMRDLWHIYRLMCFAGIWQARLDDR